MAKRKAEVKAPPIVAEDLGSVGKRALALCPVCDGFGGKLVSEVWKVCKRCKGDGRVYADTLEQYRRPDEGGTHATDAP